MSIHKKSIATALASLALIPFTALPADAATSHARSSRFDISLRATGYLDMWSKTSLDRNGWWKLRKVTITTPNDGRLDSCPSLSEQRLRVWVKFPSGTRKVYESVGRRTCKENGQVREVFHVNRQIRNYPVKVLYEVDRIHIKFPIGEREATAQDWI